MSVLEEVKRRGFKLAAHIAEVLLLLVFVIFILLY